jgi:dephospho-CoA kinase
MIHARARDAVAAGVSAYAILEIPLLAETGARDRYGFIDRVLIVDCDEATRIRRVMARSGLPEEEVRRIIAAQASDATRRALADDVIANRGDLATLEAAVTVLHETYEKLATEKVKTSC